MLPAKARSTLEEVKRNLAAVADRDYAEPPIVLLEGRWLERERKQQPMNHAKKKSEGFQTMCRRREW